MPKPAAATWKSQRSKGIASRTVSSAAAAMPKASTKSGRRRMRSKSGPAPTTPTPSPTASAAASRPDARQIEAERAGEIGLVHARQHQHHPERDEGRCEEGEQGGAA